ncbi:MAG: PP2C family protein-serine/threonine phosphatase [bacterium]
MKNLKLPKCLIKYRELITALSASNLKSVIILFNSNGAIKWYNWILPRVTAFSQKALERKKITSLIMPSWEENNKKIFYSTLFSGKPQIFSFILKTNSRFKTSYDSEISYEVKFEPFGIRGSASTLPIGKNLTLMVTRMIYYSVDKSIGSNPVKNSIIIDKNYRIIAYSSNISLLVRHPAWKILGMPVKELFVKTDWDKIQTNRNKIVRYYDRIKRNSTASWEKHYFFKFNNSKILDNFWFDTVNKWEIRNSFLTYKKKCDISYFTCKNPINFAKFDLKIRICFKGTIKNRFALFINGIGGEFDPKNRTPDANGYLFDIFDIYVRFRRLTRTIGCNSCRIKEKYGQRELIFQKTGGYFSIYLDGYPLSEFKDIDLLFNNKYKYCGMLLGQPCMIFKFEIFLRKSLLVQKEIPPQKNELRFKYVPDRWFRINEPIIDGRNEGITGEILFDDITELKAKQQKLEISEAEKKTYIQKLDREFDEAKAIQQSLIPQKLPSIKGVGIAARFIPWGKVGGDLYDLFMLDSDNLVLLLFDVCGHGLAAAFITSMTKMIIRNNIAKYDSLCKIADSTNNDLEANIKTEHFVTVFFGILNIRTMELKYVCGGHIPPLQFSNFKNKVEILKFGGPPLGMFPNTSYKEHRMQLAAGDKLLLYTDGLNESFNSRFEQFGNNRIADIFKNFASQKPYYILDRILSELKLFMSGKPSDDDITMVLLGLD